MQIEYERPVSYAARWAHRLAYFSLVLAIAVVVAHRFGPVLTPNLLAILSFCVVISGLGFLLALVGFSSLWRVGAKGGRASFMAVVYALPILAPFAAGMWLYEKTPKIWEVSSDLLEVPQWLEEPDYQQMWLGRRSPADDLARESQYLAYPELVGHRYEGALDRVAAGVRAAAAHQRMIITSEKLPKGVTGLPAQPQEDDEVTAGGLIPIPQSRPQNSVSLLLQGQQAVDTTARFQGTLRSLVTGVEYDFVIRLREEAETTLADIRVAARYGQFDLGSSAAIAISFLSALDAELLGIAGD